MGFFGGRPLFERVFMVDFRNEVDRDAKVDASPYTDSQGGVIQFGNAGAAGATFGITAAGLVNIGTAGVNISGAVRTAPYALYAMPTLGSFTRRDILYIAMDIQVVAPAGSIGGIVLIEQTDQQNSSRNYIGVVSGTPTISAQRTQSGNQFTIGTPYTPGALPATIRMETFAGLGFDWDFCADAADMPWPPNSAATLQGLVTRHPLTDTPVGWDVGAIWDPTSNNAHLVFGVAGAATLTVQRLCVERLDIGRL